MSVCYLKNQKHDVYVDKYGRKGMTGMAAAPFCPVTFVIISIFNRSYPNIQIPCKVVGFFVGFRGVFFLPDRSVADLFLLHWVLC